MCANFDSKINSSTSASRPNFDASEARNFDTDTAPLVADIGHELCNLVSNIKTRLYLTQKSPHQMAEHLTGLESLVNHLDALVHKLMTISQPNVPAQEPMPLNLNELVAQVLTVYEPAITIKKQKVIFEAGSELSPILADDLDIERVVINILGNALEYTPEAGTIYLTTSQTCDSVMLTVKDTGIGISPHALPHIFERFYRSKEAQRAASGIGLGLAIVRGLVEKYGGHIEVESSLGIGSVFNVIFPTRVND